MARTKGSKNKTDKNKVTTLEAQIAQAESTKKALDGEIEALAAKIAAERKELNAKKVTSRNLAGRIAKLNTRKENAIKSEAEKAKKAEAQELLASLLAEGKSADDIIKALNS